MSQRSLRVDGDGFVGRQEELRTLRHALDAAVGGRGSLVLLSGEPGIGKSRLADRLARDARDRGIQAPLARCWEDAGAPAFWPWVQVMRSVLRVHGPDAARRHLGERAADLVHLLPELREVFPELAPALTTDPETARFRLFDAAAAWLLSVASPSGMLIIIDDLQSADAGSVLLLQFMAGQLPDSHVVIVATHRDVELLPDRAMSRAISDLARDPATRALRIGGLSVDASESFLVATAGADVRPGLASTLHRATGGNPLFLGEAVKLLAVEGRLAEVHDASALRLAVPPGIREVIARRVRHLDEAAAVAAEVAAVIGPEFGLDLVARICGLSPDDALDRVSAMVREGLVAEMPGSATRFRFAHPLIRETVYDGLSPARRVRLHRATADALEARYASSPDHFAELALHFYQAARGGADAEKAVEYARRAGEHAAASLGYEEAARLYGTALQALADRDQPDEDLRGRLMLALGDAQARGGELFAARSTFLQAATEARRSANARNLAQAALGYGGRFIWPRAGNDRLLVPLLEDALVALGRDDDRLRVRLLARLSCALRSDPDRSRSDALSSEAVELARQIGEPGLLGYALSGRWGATWWPENAEERLALAREIEAVAVEAGDAERIIDGQLFQCMSLLDLCRVAEAVAVLERVETGARALRQPAQVWMVAAERTIIALLQGDWRTADALLEEAGVPRRPVTPVMDDVSSHRMHRFLRRREQGNAAAEEADVRDAIERFPWYPVWRAALSCLLLDAGRRLEAQATLDELMGDRALYRDNEWLFGMAFASEAAARLGDASAARDLYWQLLPFAGSLAIGPTEGSIGPIDYYLGLLASAGDLDHDGSDAERHLRAAIRLNDQMNAAPWRARAQVALARHRIGRHGEQDAGSAELLAAALRTASALEMASLLDEIAACSSARGPTVTAGGPTVTSAPIAPSLLRNGDVWSVHYGDDAFMLRDARGLHHLARLLANPHREIHALDLASAHGVGARSVHPGIASASEQEVRGLGDAGEVLDPEARASYRERIDELREEIEDAEGASDPERAARAGAELEFITAELSRAVGLGGRDRRSASAGERARVSVTRAIRAAIVRIGEQSPTLAQHLGDTVHTGTYCSYTPDRRVSIRWIT